MEQLNSNEDQENEKKSVFPDINLYSFSNLPSTIREKNEEIEKDLLTIFERKIIPLQKGHKKTNSLGNRKFNQQKKYTILPMRRRISTYFGTSEEKELPNSTKIKRILLEQKKRHEGELPLSDDDDNKKNKNLFFLSEVNKKNKNLKTSFSASNNIIKKIKKKNRNKNYFQTIQKDIKRLDYANTINLKDIKRNKKRFENVENYMENLIRAYKWKFIMTDSDKDLRPDTFFGKAGQDPFGKLAFNQRLDSMINNLRGKGLSLVNMKYFLKKRDENYTIKLKLNKRIQDEKEKRLFIRNLLESNKIIFNGIMNDN